MADCEATSRRYPPVGYPKSLLQVPARRIQDVEGTHLQKVESRLKQRGEVSRRDMGNIDRQIGVDPWTAAVLKSSKGTVPTREAYVALPKRAVRAAFSAAGLPREKAEASSLYHLAIAASAEPTLKRLKALKTQASQHRTAWILHGGTPLDAQLSFVSRALPPAPAEARAMAIEQHRVDLTSTFVTDKSLLDSVRSFSSAWARQHMIRAHQLLDVPDWPSQSSCLERGSGKGGLLREMLSSCAFDDLPSDLSTDQMGAVAGLQARFVQKALKDFRTNPVPRHRVTCLSERGVKTRVVTVGPAWAQTLGHTVRKRILRGLKSTPGTFAPLTGANDEDILRLFQGGHAETLVSTDLTRATDVLPHDLLQAVVDGLDDSQRFSSLEIEILRALSGPQDLEYGGGTKALRSTRGTLMGLPTSWCLLSLVHLWWLDEVRRTSPVGPQRTRHRGSICGDDALIATTVIGANRYKNLVAQCGGQPSEGKHYESRGGKLDGIPLRGVFLEKLFEFSVEGSRIGGGRRCAAIPVKGLTSKSLPREFFGSTPVRCDSFGLVQIMCLDAIAASSPNLEGPCRSYIRNSVPWLQSFSDAIGLAPGYPLALGGYRFSQATDESELLARQVRDSGRSFTVSIRREADPDWRMATQWSSEGRSLAISEGELLDCGRLDPLPMDGIGPAQKGQVRLPEGKWTIYEEDERVLATVIGMYSQVKAFSERRAEVYHLRSKDIKRGLRRLRLEGQKALSDIPVSELESRCARRIAWKSPDEGDTERGINWTADSLQPCRDAVAKVSLLLIPGGKLPLPRRLQAVGKVT